MPSPSFFMIMMLCFYIALNVYLLARLLRTLADTGAARFFPAAAIVLLALSFPVGRILSRRLPGRFSEALIFAGTLYLAPMIYAFILTVAADILRALNFAFRITPHPPPYLKKGRVRMVAGIVFLSLAVSLAGAYNASKPAVRHLSFDLPPARAGEGDFRIAAVSDIHLGHFVTNRRLSQLVRLINAEKPDIVLLAGDIIDDPSLFCGRASEAETAAILRTVKADMGVWAIPGNHEYYGGVERAAQILKEGGVGFMRDEWAAPRGRLLLIGRDDRASERIEGRVRKPLQDILDDAANTLAGQLGTLPIIVLDHQPIGLEDASRAGVTMQISGHAHRGQLFPVNFIVALLYEKYYGPHRKGETSYYISSGAGTWGPPVRTTGRPEIAVINMRVK